MMLQSKQTAKAMIQRILADRHLSTGYLVKEEEDKYFVSLVQIPDRENIMMHIMDTDETVEQ